MAQPQLAAETDFHFSSSHAVQAGHPNNNVVPLHISDERTRQAIETVKAAIKLRTKRDQILGAAIFSDPAWDMLLDLAVACHEKRSTSISNACVASRAPKSTSLRYMSQLEEKGLVARGPNPKDNRASIVSITAEGMKIIVDIFAAPISTSAETRKPGHAHFA